MKENSIPDASTTVLTARIPSDLHRRVKAKLAAKGLTFQGLILEAVEQESGGHIKAAKATEELPGVSVDLSADESLWIQKLLNLLRSPYGEAAKYQIETLRALSQVEEIAHDAKARGKGGTEELWAKALEAVRAVRHPIDAAQRKIGTGAHSGRHRKGDDGDSG
jgi:hypothetical protein